MRKHVLLAITVLLAISSFWSSARAADPISLQMDEGSGTAVADVSGQGNNGALVDVGTQGTIGWTAGHAGAGVYMNGDYIRVNRSSSLDITGAFHASMWVKPNGSGQWDPIPGGQIERLSRADGGFSKGGSAPNTGYGVYIPANAVVHGVIAFKNAGLKDFWGQEAVAADRVVAGQWNHIAMEFDGVQTYRLWVNGSLRYENKLPVPDSVLVSSRDLRIGYNQWTNGYLDGVVDEFVISVPTYANPAPSNPGVVILGQDTPQTRLAAGEFSRYAKLITGRDHPIVASAVGLDAVFLIGHRTGASVPGLEGAQLPDVYGTLPQDTGVYMSPEQDSYLITSVPAGGPRSLLLAGLKDTGTLYAVYDYFERFCDVGYFWDGDHVESRPALPINGVYVREVPRFGFRQMHSYIGPSNGVGFMPVRTHYFNIEQIDNFISYYAKNRLNVLLLELSPQSSGVLEKDNPSPVGSYEFIYPFAVRWDYWHHVVQYARERGIKIMFQSEMSDSQADWQKVVQEYGTDHLYFTGFGESTAPAAIQRVKDRAAMWRTIDPQSRLCIYGYEFNGWTSQMFYDFCTAPDLPDNLLLIDLLGCDWGSSVERANGFYGKAWGTGIIHSFTAYADILHSRMRMYLGRLQAYATGQWANTLTTFVMGPEGHIGAADPWMVYCYSKMSWNPLSVTVESLAGDYARARFGRAAQLNMYDSLLQLETYNNNRPAPNITSDGRTVFPLHRRTMVWNPEPLFTTEQSWGDTLLNLNLAPYFGSVSSAMNCWDSTKDQPLYQGWLFQLERSCLAEIASRDIVGLWRYYQCGTGAFQAGNPTAAGRHIKAFDERYDHLKRTLDKLEYLMSKDPDYSFDRFLDIVLAVPGIYPGARTRLTSDGFYYGDGYMRNENYEGLHYIYRRETEGFLDILRQRLAVGNAAMIDLDRYDNPDLSTLFNTVRTEAMNRTNWELPPTPGTKRDAVGQVGQHLVTEATAISLLPDIPPIWTGGAGQSVNEPAFSHGAGAYDLPFSVTVSCSTPGATIRYTVDGSEPTKASPTVSSGSSIVIDRPTTLKARAYRSGYTPSLVTSATYTRVTLAECKRQPNGAAVSIGGLIVTAVFPDMFYVEHEDRSAGIAVHKSEVGVSVGYAVEIAGTMMTNALGERYIEASTVLHTGSGSVSPVGLPCRSIGGGDWLYNPATGAGQSGVVDGVGLNNTGLLVATAGRVTFVGAGHFFIDDGSPLSNPFGRTGIMVQAAGLSLPPLGSYVKVTGISTRYEAGGAFYRALRVRNQADIVP